jgi:hypothetical protein
MAPTQLSLDFNLPPGVRFTRRALILPQEFSREQWTSLGEYLCHARGSLTFWKTDWIAAGRAKFGDQEVAMVLEDLEERFRKERDAEALNDLQEDLLKQPRLEGLKVRIDGLPLEHHIELAKMTDEVDQKMWGELSMKHDLTPAELRVSRKLGHVKKFDPAQAQRPSAGVSTVLGLRTQWDLLRKQIGDQWKEWDVTTARDFCETLRPIVEFYDEVRAAHAGKAPPSEDLAKVRAAFAAGDDISVGKIQRRMRMGYTVAVAILDAMIEAGEIKDGVRVEMTKA